MDTVKNIIKICDEMLEFSKTAGTVVNDEIDYDVLAEEYAQQQAYENGRVYNKKYDFEKSFKKHNKKIIWKISI